MRYKASLNITLVSNEIALKLLSPIIVVLANVIALLRCSIVSVDTFILR
jgi:hypothetical protein